MLAAVIFSNTYWTFWDVVLLFFFFIPLVMLWFFCLVDIFRRTDLSGWGKAAWLVGLIIFAWFGTLAYLITRPSEPEYTETTQYRAPPSRPASGQ